MTVNSQKDLFYLKRIGELVAKTLQEMLENVKPGMTTEELDAIGERILRKKGARSAPKLVYNFPKTTCICVNEEVAHGIPGPKVINHGDLVNIDVSAELDGYFADTGASIAVTPVLPNIEGLCCCSQKALQRAISIVKAGTKINEIGKVIQDEASTAGFTVIKNLCGHGLGLSLHEEPKDIVNFYMPLDKRILREGQVIAIEPFISTHAEYVEEDKDGWTLKTLDGSFVAQYEHTIVVTKGNPIVLTALN